jgi:outer membrane protein assembly factor BamB
MQRHWSGYVAHVRPCPRCGWENDESALFCVSCAADIRDTPRIASSDSKPGLAVLQKRLRRERRKSERSRAVETTGGGGWIGFGAVLIVAVLVVGPDRTVTVATWLVAVVSALVGIWQIRRDQHAMRVWGALLAGSAALVLVFVGFRAIQASGELSSLPTAEAIATPTSVLTSTGSEATPGPAIAGNVPMFGGGPSHDGQMPGPAPGASPKLAWQMDTGGELYGSPSLADGMLYVTSKAGTIYAIDASTGNEVWHREVTSYVTRASPAVIDGVVYVGAGFSFSALDAATGEERWTVPLQYGGHASPTVNGDLIVVSSQQGWLYALRTDSGELAWRVPTEGIAFGAAAMTDGAVIYGTDEGIVYNVHPTAGTMNWRTSIPGAIYATPVISGGMVLVTTQSGELFALSLDTGDKVWTASHGSSQQPASNGEIVVLAANDGGVYGLDAATGEQRWLYPTGKDSLTAPVITGNVAIFGAGNTLLAVDITTGEAVWYYLAGDMIESPSVVAQGYVFFGSRDGFLNAVSDR